MFIKKQNRFFSYFLILCALLSFTFVNSIVLAEEEEEGEEIEWGYNCLEIPPLAWAHEFHDCAGESQSPIDVIVRNAKLDTLPPLNFEYDETELEIENNGHTIQANVDEEVASVRVEDTTYFLRQFHWHTPSEHWKDGENFPMELHLVHQSEEGEFLVIGAFVVPGEVNDELDKFWTRLDDDLGEEEGSAFVGSFELKHLIPTVGDIKTLRYSGSFTTPPCTEEVNWVVMNDPIELSSEQIEAFQELFLEEEEFPAGNARPVQPLNGRTVEKSFRR